MATYQVLYLKTENTFAMRLLKFFNFAQTPESKKQEFRKYLEKSGVIDALTKGL